MKNMGVIYAGNTHNFDLQSEIEKILPVGENQKTVTGEKINLDSVWQALERENKVHLSKEGKPRYDLLSDVLKRIKAPKLIDPLNRSSVVCSTFSKLDAEIAKSQSRSQAKDRSLLRKEQYRQVWRLLSATYASGAKGTLEIIEGVIGNYRNLDSGKILVKDELIAALKNKNLDPASRKKAERLVNKYFDQIAKQNKPTQDNLEKIHKNISADMKITKPQKRPPRK